MSYAAFPVNDVLAACENYNNWRNAGIDAQRNEMIDRCIRWHTTGLTGWFHRKLGHTIDRGWAQQYLKKGSLFSAYNIQDIADWGRAGYIDNLQSLAEIAQIRGVTTIHVDANTADSLKGFWPQAED